MQRNAKETIPTRSMRLMYCGQDGQISSCERAALPRFALYTEATIKYENAGDYSSTRYPDRLGYGAGDIGRESRVLSCPKEIYNQRGRDLQSVPNSSGGMDERGFPIFHISSDARRRSECRNSSNPELGRPEEIPTNNSPHFLANWGNTRLRKASQITSCAAIFLMLVFLGRSCSLDWQTEVDRILHMNLIQLTEYKIHPDGFTRG